MSSPQEPPVRGAEEQVAPVATENELPASAYGLTPTVVAYYAGLFDGEGCVFITRPSPSNPRRHRLRAQIAMTHEPTIAAVRATFGGNVRTPNVAKYNPRARPRYDWMVSGSTAAEFLRTLRPYLLTKAEAADTGLAFAETIGTRGGDFDAKRFAQREAIRLQLGKVNRRGC